MDPDVFFSLKPFASLKISAHWFSRLVRKQTNTQTHWHPIASEEGWCIFKYLAPSLLMTLLRSSMCAPNGQYKSDVIRWISGEQRVIPVIMSLIHPAVNMELPGNTNTQIKYVRD